MLLAFRSAYAYAEDVPLRAITRVGLPVPGCVSGGEIRCFVELVRFEQRVVVDERLHDSAEDGVRGYGCEVRHGLRSGGEVDAVDEVVCTD